MIIVSLIAAILGMVLGTAGFTISLMSYLRDRPHVSLTLSWDMANSQTGQMFGLAKVSNVGRRPVFISVVAIKLPDGFAHSHLFLDTAVTGTKLSEGDKPIAHLVNYSGLAQYSQFWREIRAYAEDSTGKRYFSVPPAKSDQAPSWVAT